MRYRPADLEKNFKAFKAGDFEALDLILNSEKDRLFDYVMRMTGQLSRSAATTEEVIGVVTPVADREETLQELLVLLYKTARNFTIEIWNADTSRLENSVYATVAGGKPVKNAEDLLALEHVVRSLPAKQREILLLRERFGFSPDEIAELTGYATGDVEEIFAQALGITEAALPGFADRVPELMTKILGFQMPEDASVVTQNLSMVFKDLKKSSRSTPGGWMRLISRLIFVGLVVYGFMNYELILEFYKKITTS
jgi:DNA-directed RNA polymerase specialized sigma24 family protein